MTRLQCDLNKQVFTAGAFKYLIKKLGLETWNGFNSKFCLSRILRGILARIKIHMRFLLIINNEVFQLR